MAHGCSEGSGKRGKKKENSLWVEGKEGAR